ncbi:FliG C-terminal domain-containing protein [Vibrio breoganii]
MSEKDNGFQNADGVAILLLTIGAEKGGELLRKFSAVQQREITVAMSKFKDIGIEDASAAIAQFFRDYKRHSGIVGGSKEVISQYLDTALGGNLAKDVIANLYGDELRNKAQKLSWIPNDILVGMINEHHVNMQALLIAHLPKEKVGGVFEEYDESVQKMLLKEIVNLKEITTSQADTLLDIIDECALKYSHGRSQTIDSHKVAAEVLNRVPGNKDVLLQFLDEVDTEQAEAVRERMVDFFVLFSQSILVLEKVMEATDVSDWALALKGTAQEQRDFILSTMVERKARSLKEEIEVAGAVMSKDVEAARKRIMVVVRELAREEEITLVLTNDEMVN